MKIIESNLHKENFRLAESVMSLGNGYMGMRGNFEEKYSGDMLRGTYIGGVWYPDPTRVGWWKTVIRNIMEKSSTVPILLELIFYWMEKNWICLRFLLKHIIEN